MMKDGPAKHVPREQTAATESSARRMVLSSRFEVRSCLGSGAFGTVYSAYDRVLGTSVAVKVLERQSADAVLAFKREFRELQDVRHPSLVQLRELLYEDEQWMLVMELVRGEELIPYVSHDPDPDLCFNRKRVASTFLQLTQGLHAIHVSGRIHRDFKPANVKVTGDGRAVLFDFGLVTRTDVTVSNVAGTVLYMAPEQAMHEVLSPASDFYALGAVLYEVLAGKPAFAGSQLDILLEKQKGPPASLRSVAPNVDREWALLCDRLLDADPKRRPSVLEILRVLGSTGENHQEFVAAPSRSSLMPNADVIGRGDQLEVLERRLKRTLAGNFTLCTLFGESGIGKTRLVDTFIDRTRMQHDRVLVLRARCYENETVAFKAMDAIVDALVSELRKLPNGLCNAILPRRAALLSTVFPAMTRVRAIADLNRTERGITDRVMLRSHAFEALRELLERMAERRPIVMVIDDLQWADAESMELLAELFRPPHPPCLMLLTVSRPLAECPPEIEQGLEAILASQDEHDSITLDRLSEADATRVALSLMSEKNQQWAERIALESEGRPLFIDLLVRHTQHTRDAKSLDEALASHIASLDEASKTLLELSCVAGTPIPRSCLAEAADLDGDTFASELARLRLLHLLRTHRGRDTDSVEPFHDRIRTHVVEAIAPERRERYHRRIASALEPVAAIDRERVAQHWAASGQKERAAVAALSAADRAFDGLAFSKAARLYGWAQSLDRSLRTNRALLVRWGDALTNAGRCSEAAQVLLSAINGANATEALELKRRVAELLFQSGKTQEGKVLAEELCASVGLPFPKSRAAAISQIVWFGARGALCSNRYDAEAPAATHADLVKLDVLWSLSSRLGPNDPYVAGALHARYYVYAHQAREPGRLAQALAAKAFGRLFEGDLVKLGLDLERATLLAERSGNAEVRAFVLYLRGACYFMSGETERALPPYTEAELALSSECLGSGWLLGVTRTSILHCAKDLGHWELLAQRYPRALLDARERGDPFLYNTAILSASYAYCLMHDRPDRAIDALAQARQWAGDVAHATYHHWIGSTAIGTYRQDPETWSRALATRDTLVKSGTMRMPMLRVAVGLRLALASLESARLAPSRREELLQQVHKEVLAFRKLPMTACRTAAEQLILAATADVEGRTEDAIALYDKTETLAISAGRMAEADVARARRGQLLAGEAGKELVRDVEQRLRQRGVRKPLHFLHAMLPSPLDLG